MMHIRQQLLQWSD